MDKAFFASKYFVISAVVAALILGAASAAYVMEGGAGGEIRIGEACAAPTLAGQPIPVEPQVVVEENGRRRTETYSLDAASYDADAIRVCARVGEILVEPAPGSAAEVVFTITGRDADAVRATLVDAAFHDDAGRLSIAAWQAGKPDRIWGMREGAQMRVVLRVPASGAWDLGATNDVGDVRASGLLLSSLDLGTDVGDIVATQLDLQGNATARADVGKVMLSFASVQTGSILVTTDVGGAEVELPQRADVGYDALGEANVGQVTLRLGPTESYDSKGSPPGERESARTVGYAEKPTKVRVEARADVGDVRIGVSG